MPTSKASGRRHKFVPMTTAQTAALQVPGRHTCECQALRHKLVNNCLKCGRIVCEQVHYCSGCVVNCVDDSLVVQAHAICHTALYSSLYTLHVQYLRIHLTIIKKRSLEQNHS